MQAAAAVFAFRGTKLTKGKTLRADLQLVMDSDLDLYITQRALSKVKSHMRRLASQQPNIHWGFFATGHSLGELCNSSWHSSHTKGLLLPVLLEAPGGEFNMYRICLQWDDQMIQNCSCIFVCDSLLITQAL